MDLCQRFGSAANLNIHLHCLMLDGVYRTTEGLPVFHTVHAPTATELQALLNRIIKRIMKFLARKGFLIEEQGMSYLAAVLFSLRVKFGNVADKIVVRALGLHLSPI
jgi:hypothetical protein